MILHFLFSPVLALPADGRTKGPTLFRGDCAAHRTPTTRSASLTCYMASQAWHDYWLGLNSQVNAADRSSVMGSLISEDVVSQVVIPPL